ncbi:MAG: phosphatase PAP2 family protein [Tissierellia bacterium]|nr:phosphatase PAP2 family protein [Tissierellia bacterium]
MNAITLIDIDILNSIQNSLKSPLLDNVMRKITALGDFGIIWILLLIVFFSTKEFREVGKTMAIAMLISFIICNILIKPIVARIRPFNLVDGINLISAPPLDYSFPSGHSMFSFTSAMVIFMMVDSKFIKYFSLVLAILISFSRLYLYFHYPTDVISGIILGSVIAYFVVTKRRKNLQTVL